jgi:hypothetical protein
LSSIYNLALPHVGLTRLILRRRVRLYVGSVLYLQ